MAPDSRRNLLSPYLLQRFAEAIMSSMDIHMTQVGVQTKSPSANLNYSLAEQQCLALNIFDHGVEDWWKYSTQYYTKPADGQTRRATCACARTKKIYCNTVHCKINESHHIEQADRALESTTNDRSRSDEFGA